MSSNAHKHRDALLLVTSLVAHGVVAFVLSRAPLPRGPLTAPSSSPAIEGAVELEVTATEPEPRAPEVPLPPEPRPPPPTTQATVHAPPVAAPTVALEEPRTSSSTPTPAPTQGPEAAPESAPPAVSLAALGVGKNPFLPGRGPSGPAASAPSAPAPPPGADMAEAKARVEASLRQAARDREAELGLGPEGPVRAALGEAMYESNAPVIGRVVFSVSADAQGHVLSVETVSADRTLADYAGMLTIARRKLGRATLRLPSTAKGARLRIEVTSAWKLPSGHDPGVDLSLFGQTFKKGEGKAATRVEVLPIPKVICTEVSESKAGEKIPTCVLSAPLLATDGDPADIGAKPRRIVGTKVIERTVL